MAISFKSLKSVINRSCSKKYVPRWSDETLSLIKEHKEFHGYFANGNVLGSGSVYFLFYELIKHFKPNHVVELGNREGAGVLAMYQAIKENDHGFLSTVDIVTDLRFVPTAIKNHSQFLNKIIGDCLSPEVISAIKNKGPVDLILFDTVHHYDQFKKEWQAYEPLLADECIVLIDDLNYEPKEQNSKQRAFDEFVDFEKLADKRIHTSGFGVLLYRREHTTKTEN